MLQREKSKSKLYREIMNRDEIWIFNLFDGMLVINETNKEGGRTRSHQIPADDDPFLLNRFFQNVEAIRRCSDLHNMSVSKNPPLLLASTEEVEEHFKMVARDNDWFDSDGEPDFYRAMDEAMMRQESYGEVGVRFEDMTDADGNIVSLDLKDEDEPEQEQNKKRKSLIDNNKVSSNVISLIRKSSSFVDVKSRLSTKSVHRKLSLMESDLTDQDWLFVYVHGADSTVRGLAKDRLVNKFDYDQKDLTRILKEEKGFSIEIEDL